MREAMLTVCAVGGKCAVPSVVLRLMAECTPPDARDECFFNEVLICPVFD